MINRNKTYLQTITNINDNTEKWVLGGTWKRNGRALVLDSMHSVINLNTLELLSQPRKVFLPTLVITYEGLIVNSGAEIFMKKMNEKQVAKTSRNK